MTFHVQKDAAGEWRWSLTAANGKKIATSGEGYKDKKDCLQAIDLVKEAGRRKPGGPPKREPRASERVALSLRMTPDLKRRLDAVAEQVGRSQSQEAEIRLERSFDRQDLLSDALSLAYGEEIAGLLMMLGHVMTDMGTRTPREAEGNTDDHWTSDAYAFNAAVEAAVTLLVAARPDRAVESSGAEAMSSADAMMRALRGERNRFSAAAETIRELLGPIATRIADDAARILEASKSEDNPESMRRVKGGKS